MKMSLLFWVLMLLWLLFGFWSYWPRSPTNRRSWGPFGGNLLLFILLLILGWESFGSPVK